MLDRPMQIFSFPLVCDVATLVRFGPYLCGFAVLTVFDLLLYTLERIQSTVIQYFCLFTFEREKKNNNNTNKRCRSNVRAVPPRHQLQIISRYECFQWIASAYEFINYIVPNTYVPRMIRIKSFSIFAFVCARSFGGRSREIAKKLRDRWNGGGGRKTAAQTVPLSRGHLMGDWNVRLGAWSKGRWH